jgi:hypothetical protein
VQDLATVIEEGREPGGEVEAAAVELGQVRDETGRGLLLAASERLQLRFEVLGCRSSWVIKYHDIEPNRDRFSTTAASLAKISNGEATPQASA